MRHGKFWEELEKLRQSYSAGPVEGDCDSDFDFGFAAGMTCAYQNMTGDLTILLEKFRPMTRKKHGE